MYYIATVHKCRSAVNAHESFVMHPAQISAALKVAGYRQTDLADELGVAPTTVGAVIHGRSRSTQIEERIAAITGYVLAELWPQWHGERPLQLTSEERSLVLLYRELPPMQRVQVLPVLREMFIDTRPSPSPLGTTVIAIGNSHAAGRDQTIGSPPRKKR